MSDTFDLTSLFDTTAAPAGDASMVADALSNAADTTTSVSDVANAADAGPALDTSTGLDTSVPTDIPAPQPDATDVTAANNDTGIPPGESLPAPKPMDGIDTTPMQPVQSGTLNSMDSLNKPGLIDQASKFAKENPTAAAIIGKALAGAGGGAITALAVQNKIKAEREIIDQQRQDVIRRGQVQKLPPSTFTPKPGGIIDAAGK